MFIGRILVNSGNYHFPLDPVLIQLAYLGINAYFVFFYRRGRIRISRKIQASTVVAAALFVYVFLFCFVFVNPLMRQYRSTMLQRQGMFVSVVILGALGLRKYKLFDEFLKATFYTISIVLIIQFLTNLSDLQYFNIRTILSSAERTRANFGLGHYNALGSLCVCNVLIWLLMRKRRGKKKQAQIQKIFERCAIVLSLIMLVVSASRSSLTGLGLYLCVYVFLGLERMHLGKYLAWTIRISVIVAALLFLFLALDISMEELLLESNRFTLVDVAIPTFLRSGRTMIGLGLAPSEEYGVNATPYTTYWLDNGYVYTLFTTGYLGFLIYLVALIAIAHKMYVLHKLDIGIPVIGVFVVYLYAAMFETTLFSGTTPNYPYMILFLMYTSDYFLKEKSVQEEDHKLQRR